MPRDLSQIEQELKSKKMFLVQEIECLQADLREPRKSVSELSEVEWQNEISIGLIETMEKELKAIEVALEKIEKGKFGICEICKKEIGSARLKAIPQASLCYACKKEEEEEMGR